ncbi:MAG: nicotinate (nicotinamide) nucleotide adenylyltransferase [Elusimicrobia bacterium RIFCSPLOWO2_12_FULL_59_9]|nr:MAG: nicotinate (nicotinamide) nucleotide adenylyltransferase [Elusimicrobia bacterium RIFCSPLOWO2_12_FULL_59_9]
MNILIYGGSFDPPHTGHFELLGAALREIPVDRAYILPSARPAHKRLPWASFDERARMLRAGLAGRLAGPMLKKVRLSGYEKTRRGPVYTYQALAHFRRLHPGARFYLLIGGDQLGAFTTWKKYRRLLSQATLVVGARRGKDGAALAAKAKVIWLKGVFPAISSSEIRLAFLRGEKTAGKIPAAVLRRIERRGLYGLAWLNRLRRRLNAGRFAHVLQVARLAGSLAERHGADLEKAAAAALLHDAGRSLTLPRMIAYARRHKIKAPLKEEVIARCPILLHAYVGAHMAETEMGVSDPEILSAIRRHSLGDLRMSPLDKIIFVADAASEDRAFAGAARLRKIAFQNIDRAMRETVRMKLAYVKSRGGWIHPLGKKLWRKIR